MDESKTWKQSNANVAILLITAIPAVLLGVLTWLDQVQASGLLVGKGVAIASAVVGALYAAWRNLQVGDIIEGRWIVPTLQAVLVAIVAALPGPAAPTAPEPVKVPEAIVLPIAADVYQARIDASPEISKISTGDVP